MKLNLLGDLQDRGRGIWKFNNSLLSDKSYLEKVREIINDTFEEYSVGMGIQEREFSISDCLLLDVILMNVRGYTIKYSSFKKRENCREEDQIEKEINDIRQNNEHF